MDKALGAIPSPEAEKATAWTPESVGATTVLPDSCSIDSVLSMQITDQGKIGSCVGNTFEEIVRFLTGPTQDPLSWRFVYAVCKAVEGKKVLLPDGTTLDATIYPATIDANDGTYPALAAMVVRRVGVPLAKYCPNNISLDPDDFCYGRNFSKIPADALADAATRKSGADIAFPATEYGIKQAITYAKQNGGAVAILRRISDSYWRHNGVNTYDKAKLLPIAAPSAASPVVSGHEELLYAYDLESGSGRTKISWQNHWDYDWCSTGGNSRDGGRAWEYLDVWLPFIVEVRVVVPALPPPPEDFHYTFNKNLYHGMKGPDVVAWQHILALEGCFDYNPTDGSPRFTGNFLGITESGTTKLQEKYAEQILYPLGLKHGTGAVYESTRAWANAKYGNK